jgi:hypothetical protein
VVYDLTNEALVRALVTALDPQEGDDILGYEDLLRRAQRILIDEVNDTEDPTPEAQQIVTLALATLHPTADDHLVDHGTRLRRLQARIDIELSKWTSAMIQPPGPSGATAVPEPLPAPVE